MNQALHTRQMFVGGQLVEYWENADHPFGWTDDDLKTYVDRQDWVLLFNAVTLLAPLPAAPYSS